MSYQQALEYLFQSLPLFSNNGIKAFKADLKNTIALCDFLGNPQQKIKTIHVAGTNGKGSTAHMIAACLQQNNIKTGLYTSPHLQDYRERIKINGQMISESFVTHFVSKIKNYSEEVKPSFFELTFAMALDYFAKEEVEVAVIETGLGGRLDSTNIISPLVSVITNIGYDHMDILGNTLEKIATEKAGIIKYKTPVVISEVLPETEQVFLEKAAKEEAAIIFAQDRYNIIQSDYEVQFLNLEVADKMEQSKLKFKLDLSGSYQAKNLLGVLTALDILKKHFSLDSKQNILALSRVKQLTGLHGRWEVISQNPLVVMDVAHNEDGVKQLLQQISKNSFDRLHLIFGMVKDKDIQKVLSLLPKEAQYYFTHAHIPRALPAMELSNQASAFGLKGNIFDQVNIALKHALQEASASDLIIVFGSVFVVGEVAVNPFTLPQ